MIAKGYKSNFGTLLKAADRGDLALVECTDAKTGQPVITVCAVHMQAGEFVMTPLAKMFDGNPYEELNPPAPKVGEAVR